jgi:xanthine dehydrogenase accessory factor
MKEVLPELERWEQRGERIAMATVISVRRSAPRPPGSKMAVNEFGEIGGSVSGGCVEGAVVEVAQRVLDGEPPQLLSFGIADADAWEVGLPCGGEIDVWVQRYEPGGLERVARADGRGAEVTVLEGPNAGTKMLVEPDGRRAGSLGAPELDDEAARITCSSMWSRHRRG